MFRRLPSLSARGGMVSRNFALSPLTRAVAFNSRTVQVVRILGSGVTRQMHSSAQCFTTDEEVVGGGAGADTSVVDAGHSDEDFEDHPLGAHFNHIQELPDLENPKLGWGPSLASHRGEVVWWDERLGFGYVRDIDSPYSLSSKRDYYICTAEIVTDPWAEEEMSVDDPRHYADIDASDTELLAARRSMVQTQIDDINQMTEGDRKSGEHLIAKQRVWFDAKEDGSGLFATNLQWEQ